MGSDGPSAAEIVGSALGRDVRLPGRRAEIETGSASVVGRVREDAALEVWVRRLRRPTRRREEDGHHLADHLLHGELARPRVNPLRDPHGLHAFGLHAFALACIGVVVEALVAAALAMHSIAFTSCGCCKGGRTHLRHAYTACWLVWRSRKKDDIGALAIICVCSDTRAAIAARQGSGFCT